MKIGVIAPSAPMGRLELQSGLIEIQSKLKDVEIFLSDKIFRQYYYYAGNDESRAKEFWKFALNPSLDALWAARGGSGAARLIPYLKKWQKQFGKPKKSKILLGYSDVTTLLEFVQSEWGWRSIHAPMPGVSQFLNMPRGVWFDIHACLSGGAPTHVFKSKLKKFRYAVKERIPSSKQTHYSGVLRGGNLSVWASLIGDPAFKLPSGVKNILFFEDVSEAPYRIERMVYQLYRANAFKNTQAIILGDFTHCEDKVYEVLSSNQASSNKIPLRKAVPLRKALWHAFQQVAEENKIPVFYGVKSGHGENRYPLLFGKVLKITSEGVCSF